MRYAEEKTDKWEVMRYLYLSLQEDPHTPPATQLVRIPEWRDGEAPVCIAWLYEEKMGMVARWTQRRGG